MRNHNLRILPRDEGVEEAVASDGGDQYKSGQEQEPEHGDDDVQSIKFNDFLVKNLHDFHFVSKKLVGFLVQDIPDDDDDGEILCDCCSKPSKV